VDHRLTVLFGIEYPIFAFSRAPTGSPATHATPKSSRCTGLCPVERGTYG